MPQITLTEEQERLLKSTNEPLRVADRQGRVLGQLWPPVPDEEEIIAEARRRLASKAGSVPAARVREVLHALEQEWQRLGGFDRAHLHALLERFRGESA